MSVKALDALPGSFPRSLFMALPLWFTPVPACEPSRIHLDFGGT